MTTQVRQPAPQPVPLARVARVLERIDDKINGHLPPCVDIFKKGKGFGFLSALQTLFKSRPQLQVNRILAPRFIFHMSYVGLCSLIKREQPYNSIPTKPGNEIMLGGIPTLKTNMSSLNRRDIAGVLAVCENWERDGSVLSTLRTPTTEEWASTGAELETIEKKDHTPLEVKELESAADFIHEKLADGDVYVHCKAGHGRSAQAVVAYFIKHENMAPADAITQVKQHRKNASLMTLEQIKSRFPKARLQNVQDNKQSINTKIIEIRKVQNPNIHQTSALKQLIRLCNFHKLKEKCG